MHTEAKACIYWERDAFCASSSVLPLFFFLYNTKSAAIPFTHKHVSLPLSFTCFYMPKFCSVLTGWMGVHDGVVPTMS